MIERFRRFRRHPWVRWGAPFLFLALAVFFLRDRTDFFIRGLAAVRRADPAGVGAVLLASLASLYAMATVLRLLLRAGGVKVRRRDANALTFASNSWSSSFPGGQAFSTVLQYQTMRSWGAGVMVCSWQIVLSGALSTMWLVALGVSAIVVLGADLSLLSLLGTFGIMSLLAWAVYWASDNPRYVARWVRRWWPRFNRLRRRDRNEGLDDILDHVHQLHDVRLTVPRFAVVALWSLLNWCFDIVALWASVWAVTGVFPAIYADADHTTIAGVTLAYVTAKIAGTVQATPGGLGPVEAAMTATLVAVGMTGVNAFGAVFVYRMISFLTVTAIGWLVYLVYFTRRGVNKKSLAAASAVTAPEDRNRLR
ncbi:lysylphosphatidylglycerol synthase transmembrane domain-containing protein [Corynebacterium pygosceleis]|uniref:lysylphosphatidylglycerol synthase transmembrane domain-containing protein n=1 Tax=Corynebacterium pygosceleis TaxID=2800406 RepID=UPI002002F002|nr:YbhN family protein [Corynebacterium pygosceleis]MCK7675253.1 YbhN family protein [Corynebacterium pygosceleis]